MLKHEIKDASFGDLVDEFNDQNKSYNHNSNNLAKLLRAIGITSGTYSNDAGDLLVAFLDDNPEVVEVIMDKISDIGEQCDDWRTELESNIEADATFRADKSEDDPELFDIVRSDTGETIFKLLTKYEASVKVQELNDEVNDMDEPLEPEAHLELRSIRFVAEHP